MGFEHLLRLSLSLTVLCVVVYSQHNVARFAEDEIKEILKMHNDLRRSVYNAANMRELTWNEAVAMAASEWGTECEYVTRPDNRWGQNMNYFYGSDYHKTKLELFTHSFQSWANETIHYDYRRYRACGRKNVCSYVQLIAADAEEVGCVIVRCPRLQLKEPYGIQTHAKLLVCFYTPWVDINNRAVFIPEKRCSACPSGTVCVDNLCSSRFSGKDPLQKTQGIGEPRIRIGVSSISGSRPESKEKTGRHGDRQPATRESRGRGQSTDTVVSGKEIVRNPERSMSNNAGEELNNNNRLSDSSGHSTESVVVYTPNNRVVPFPGKKEARDIRRIEKFEKKLEKRKKRKEERQKKRKNEKKSRAELVQKPEKITKTDNSTVLSRKKRQLSYEDAMYLRRLEYHRYLRQLREREIQERERRRQYEEELRRRRHQHRRHREMMELRRHTDEQRRVYDERERRRVRRLQEYRRRQELMAMLQSEGELTGEEQFNTISAHNIMRREVGSQELSWSSHLEKWAKYVIRCETEYPGPISCYTNFGKTSGASQEIYSVVYNWGAEGDDLRQPLRYGCRTPYDQSMCNHNSILRDPSLTQMACAAKNCGYQRQLTCIYNSS